MNQRLYDSCYRSDSAYWGGEPTTIARQLVEQGLSLLLDGFSKRPVRFVDIGCGDGRDALFYASRGIDVTGVDISPPGLKALNQKAAEAGYGDLIHTLESDISDFRIETPCHAVVSSGALHYIPPDERAGVLSHYKKLVYPGGIIAATVIIEKPFIDAAPDKDKSVTLFRSGEILHYLWNWEVLWVVEEIRPCNSSGVPHRHAFNRVIARKP